MGISFIRKIYGYHIKDDYLPETTTVQLSREVLVESQMYYEQKYCIEIHNIKDLRQIFEYIRYVFIVLR